MKRYNTYPGCQVSVELISSKIESYPRQQISFFFGDGEREPGYIESEDYGL